jgi:C4-type Zn-finger protein
MTCPRCGGLVVQEYLLNPRQGSLSGFHGWRCLNCGAIHDDVICLNQRLPPSLKRVRSPVAGVVLASRRVKSLARSRRAGGRKGNSHVKNMHSGRR